MNLPDPLTLAFIEGIGGPELLMVLVIVLLLFGGKKLPELAKGLGKSIREIKKATSGVEEEFRRAINEEPETPRPKLTQTPAAKPAEPPSLDDPAVEPAPPPKPPPPKPTDEV